MVKIVLVVFTKTTIEISIFNLKVNTSRFHNNQKTEEERNLEQSSWINLKFTIVGRLSAEYITKPKEIVPHNLICLCRTGPRF